MPSSDYELEEEFDSDDNSEQTFGEEEDRERGRGRASRDRRKAACYWQPRVRRLERKIRVQGIFCSLCSQLMRGMPVWYDRLCGCRAVFHEWCWPQWRAATTEEKQWCPHCAAETCAICQEQGGSGNFGCPNQHQFHPTCLADLRASQYGARCPLCRQPPLGGA